MASNRARRRALGGKREVRRRHREDVVRVIELDREGFSRSTIAATVGLNEGLVSLILEKAAEVEEGGGGGR